jgi:hypothetical protein
MTDREIHIRRLTEEARELRQIVAAQQRFIGGLQASETRLLARLRELEQWGSVKQMRAPKLVCAKCGARLADPSARLYVTAGQHVCLDALACQRRTLRVPA